MMHEFPVDTLAAGPRYLQVYVALRDRLRAGAYQPGQRLPNQLQLAREFGVSFMTLRRAVELLERDGYLVSRHGLGTFATYQPGQAPPVLVIDQEDAARQHLRAVLEAEGLSIIEAAASEEALQFAQQAGVERVFLDATVAHGNGVALLPRLRALRPGISIVVLWSAPEDLAALDDPRVWPAIVLRKPFQPAQVREALRLSGRVAASRD